MLLFQGQKCGAETISWLTDHNFDNWLMVIYQEKMGNMLWFQFFKYKALLL